MWSSYPASASAKQQTTLHGEMMQETQEVVGKAYLETDIDCLRQEDELKKRNQKKNIASHKDKTEQKMSLPSPELCPETLGRMGSHNPIPTPIFCSPSSTNPLLHWDDGLTNRSVSLPRGINMVSDQNLIIKVGMYVCVWGYLLHCSGTKDV